MDTITVNELKALIDAQIAQGLGNKKILISEDDEGNGYHELFFGFTAPGFLKDGMTNLPFGVDAQKAIDEYIILG